MAGETELERLVVRLVGDASGYLGMLQQAQTATVQTGGSVQRASVDIQNYAKGLQQWSQGVVSQLMGVAGIAVSLNSLFTGVKLAASFEKNEVAFGTMLKDMEAGKDLMKELATFGAQTPLNLPDIQNATKILLQFGVQGGDVVDTLRMLGDSVNGDAQKLQSMALAFGQAKAAGRLMGNDVFQMINAGFNPLQETAEHLEKTIGGLASQHLVNLKKKMEQGQFTIKMMEDSFKRATSEGGRFFNGMANASKTLDGLFSTMQDDIGAFLRTLGTLVTEALHLKEVVAGVSIVFQGMTEYINKLPAGVKTLVASLGSFVGGLTGIIGIWPYLSKAALPVLSAVWTAFKLLGGPLGWITAGITLIGTVITQQFGGIEKLTKYLGEQLEGVWEVLFGSDKKNKKGDDKEKTGPIIEFVKFVKKAWEDLQEFVKPIWQAIVSLATAAWKKISQGVIWLWGQIQTVFGKISEYAASAWKAVGGEEINWTNIRDQVRDAIIFIEFTLENLGLVASYVWAGIKYHAVAMGNQFTYVFTEVIPAAAKWFYNNWIKIVGAALGWYIPKVALMGKWIVDVFNAIPWARLWDGFRNAAIAAAANLVNIFTHLPEIMAAGLAGGKALMDTLWPDVGKNPEEFADKIEKMKENIQKELNAGAALEFGKFELPERRIGNIEKQLKEEYEKLGKEVGEKFNEFRDRKLKEWQDQGKITEEESKKIKSPGKKEEEAWKAASKAAGQYNAVLISSAEAITRFEKYLDSIRKPLGLGDIKGAPGEDVPGTRVAKPGDVEFVGPQRPNDQNPGFKAEGGRLEQRGPQDVPPDKNPVEIQRQQLEALKKLIEIGLEQARKAAGIVPLPAEL